MKHVFLLVIALLVTSTTLHAAEPKASDPPEYVGPPLPQHAETNRRFSGIPSLAVAPEGRLWATWYGGETPGEDLNNYVVLSTSNDNGATWEEVLIVDPDGPGPSRSFDPQVWISPDGRLFLFWSQMCGGLNLWYIETDAPDSAKPTWTAPRDMGYGVMMGKPLVLSSGEWVLPRSTWRTNDNSAQMVVSADAGKTWTLRGACNVPVEDRQFDEHLFIERTEGSIWLLVRTTYGIGESISTDRGATWPDLKPLALPHTPARFFIRTLASGNLLLVKHGPLDGQTGRSHLTAYISTDEGASWGGGLLLDERNHVSYPDGQQTPDGLIRIIYDYRRTAERNILMATFREEDAAAGKPVSDAVRLRQVVSVASGGLKKASVAHPISDNKDGAALRTETPGTLASAGVEARPLVRNVTLFSDRTYTAEEFPDTLKGAHILPVAMNDNKTVTCQRAGTVFFLTPAPSRNQDSQSQALLDQGFEKVALPEMRLFGGPESYCTLYQKDCAVGETILINKWALPVFMAE